MVNKRIAEAWRRLLNLGRRGRFDAELEDEIQFHLDSRTEELVNLGVTRKLATAQARREFGPRLRLAEQTREAWRFSWLEDLGSDLRYAGRALRRNPGFAAAAIFSLALGVGLNTAIFSFTMELLFSEPSCRDASTLAEVRLGGNSHLPVREFRLVREAQPLDGVAGLREESEVNWRDGENTARLNAFTVSDNFFEVIGVPVAIGRGIQTGETDTIVVGHWFRKQRLSHVAEAIGHRLMLDGKPYTIVGVLPPNHRTVRGFGLSPHLYKVSSRETDSLAIFARKGRNATDSETRARLQAVATELDRVYPDPNIHWGKRVEVNAIAGQDRLKSLQFRTIAVFFGLVMALVGLVLLVACANVAGLLLVRAASRSHEVAVRMAIGAGRWRVVRQFLAESFVLAGLGTAAGLAINFFTTRLVDRIEITAPIPLRLVVEPDWRLALYAAGVAFLCAAVCGLVPALNASRYDVQSALKYGERQVAGPSRMRRLLVGGQIAVAVVLLSTGILFLRNLMLATTLNPGFDVQKTLWAQMRVVSERYPTAPAKFAVNQMSLNTMRSLPGIEAASLVEVVPLNDSQTSGGDLKIDDTGQTVQVSYRANAVSSDYFRAMGIPILAGRDFIGADFTQSPSAVIMNQTMARRIFGDGEVIGRTVAHHGDRLTVVGVAADSKYFTLGEENVQAMYRPITPRLRRDTVNIVLRCVVPPENLVKDATRALGALDSSAAIEVRPMKSSLGFALLPSQVGAALLGSIGLLGLVLAAVGLYGLMAYSVARRLREVGLRMALGASNIQILRLIGAEALTLLALSLSIGMGIAWFAARPLAMFLVPGLQPMDLTGIASVLAILVTTGLLATLVPARRALGVDPVSALRWE